jgi:16S rRNA (guanine527-N7)-methyltransferase
VDKTLVASTLARVLGEPLSEKRLLQFEQYANELERFGSKLNLTAIRDREEVVDKHFADSLSVSRSVPAGRLLDVGAGAGFPGVPLALVRSDIEVTLVEAAKKKVGFLKALLASLEVPNAQAVHAHLGAKPILGLFDTAVARALADVTVWLQLAKHHVKPGGRIIAMLGRAPEPTAMERAAADAEVQLLSTSTYVLPLSGDPRSLAVFLRP